MIVSAMLSNHSDYVLRNACYGDEAIITIAAFITIVTMVTMFSDTAVMAMKRGDISAALIGGCNLNLKPQVIFLF